MDKGLESTPPLTMTYPLAARQVITAALATGGGYISSQTDRILRGYFSTSEAAASGAQLLITKIRHVDSKISRSRYNV